MGDINQLIYLKTLVPAVDGPILEIGSKDYGSTSSFRDTYRGVEYVGLDMEAGPGVDVVADLTQGTGALPCEHFALGICCSVLEHVRRPWVMAEHITSLIRPGGTLYMSVPWVWRYHAYPDDYFRFSWRGIEELFPAFTWDHICYSTNVPEEIIPIPLDQPGVDNQMALMADTPGGKRKYLPYLMVNMLDTKSR
ncbi:MAG: class I SAM-dependent methyltransferase [Burkholderiales bacterium]|nr:class I SAM-dependent methyltransferase [Burkholderiales bacterium]